MIMSYIYIAQNAHGLYKRFQEVEKSLVNSHWLKVLTTVAYKGKSSDVS